MTPRNRYLGIAFTIFLGMMTIPGWPSRLLSQEYESYFNYIHTRPDEAQTNYAGNVQGLTHDSNNWFISQEWGLWKVPVGLDLAGSIECGASNVLCANLNSVSQIGAYNHVGDIDYYQYNASTGFLLLPLEHSDRSVPPAIAAFSPGNLQYIAHVQLKLPPNLSPPRNAPWVAVDPQGLFYAPHQDASGWIFIYSIDWQLLAQSGSMSLHYVDRFQLLDEVGVPLSIGGQGGDFSESGDLLYINNGYYGSYDPYKDGVSVIDMQTKKRIAKSTNDGAQPFWYGYDPDCVPPFESNCEEPEGLTVWDLDDGRAPNISGRLHVLLLDNDISDDVYIRHYTHTIYVDGNYTAEERGKPTQPFNTVSEANNLAWDGAQIKIKAGSYTEALVLSKRIRMLADGGVVRIGE